MLWNKKDTQRVILLDADKFLIRKKIKIENWYRKNSFNHTSETQRSVVFFSNFVFWEVFLPTANFSLVWPNFCTPTDWRKVAHSENFDRLGILSVGRLTLLAGSRTLGRHCMSRMIDMHHCISFLHVMMYTEIGRFAVSMVFM